MVRPKKHLGQHFLKNDSVSARIADAITFHQGIKKILEIGPGTGALTKHLLRISEDVIVAEVDEESVQYLQEHYPALEGRILFEDFLKMDLSRFETPLIIAGNFPYNISSQILFHILEHRDLVPEMVGMFQREVAKRVASGPGNKDYGILSVLLQAYYTIDYLFTVDEQDFNPPPKVKSGVIRMVRNDVKELSIPFSFFKRVVKTAFNQRRKTLRNSLKQMIGDAGITTDNAIFQKRPEQLDVEEFIGLCEMLNPK